MKTFEEALQLFLRFQPTNPGEDVKAVEARVYAEMDDGLKRTGSLVEEICGSEQAGHFVAGFMETFRRDRIPLMIMAIHLFAHGVAVGIEMEKQTEMRLD